MTGYRPVDPDLRYWQQRAAAAEDTAQMIQQENARILHSLTLERITHLGVVAEVDRLTQLLVLASLDHAAEAISDVRHIAAHLATDGFNADLEPA